MWSTLFIHMKNKMKKNLIKTVDINLLYANDYNSNKMPEAKFEALVDTIKRNGQTHPIQVVQDKKGKYRIMGGEHKWRAMKLLKYKEVDIIERHFDDDIDEKLGSVEDNLHGNSIPIREAMIVAQATKKYKLGDLERRLGQGESELRDKLFLSGNEAKINKIKETIEREHTVMIDFIVDTDAQENAERFTKKLREFAQKNGAREIKTEIGISKIKEAVCVMTFNVSNLQKNVIEDAIKHIRKRESVSKSRAFELMSADYLAGADINTPQKLAKKNSKK